MEELFNETMELQEEQTTETEIIEEFPADDATLTADESTEEEESVEKDTEQSSENAIVSENKPAKEEKLSPYEELILAEMTRRAEGADGDMPDDRLTQGLQSKDKNIRECFEYVKKQAQKQAVKGCAMIEDTQVYAWAHHYYIEPKATIDAELHPKPKVQPRTTATPPPAKGTEKTAPAKKTYKPQDAGKSNPLLQKIAKSRKKDTTPATKSADKVTTLKRNGKTFTITEFSLF